MHVKGSVVDDATGRVFQLGTWLLRHKRQKAKGWLRCEREAKVRLWNLEFWVYTPCCVL